MAFIKVHRIGTRTETLVNTAFVVALNPTPKQYGAPTGATLTLGRGDKGEQIQVLESYEDVSKILLSASD